MAYDAWSSGTDNAGAYNDSVRQVTVSIEIATKRRILEIGKRQNYYLEMRGHDKKIER